MLLDPISCSVLLIESDQAGTPCDHATLTNDDGGFFLDRFDQVDAAVGFQPIPDARRAPLTPQPPWPWPGPR